MKGFVFINWLKNISLTKKLYFVVGIMAFLIAVELFMLSFMVSTMSSARALVEGEGLWSKAQKEAVYSLTKYGYTRDEKDFQQYLKLLAVPMGDRKARLELMKPSPNLDTVRSGFLKGRLNPEDINGVIKLLTRFHNVSYLHNAIVIWTQGDYYLDMLQYLGDRLHTQVSSGYVPPGRISKTQDDIYQLNEKLTTLEDEFSQSVGEGSRWLEGLVLKILLAIAITVEFTGLFLTISVSRAISKGINEIVRIANIVAKADFSDRAKIYSGDEIGLLAGSFNQMIDDLQKKIGEEKQAENALRNQKNLYETLLTTESEMGEGVSITENEKIIYVNDAVCNIYGYSREEIINMHSFLNIIPEEEKPRLIERLKQRIQGERAQSSGETKIIRKDGKIIDIEYTVRNIQVDGRLQMLSIIRDVTEKKQNELQLRKEKERAETAEIARKIGEQFLANMSHEIRTPMNAIVGFTDIMLKTPLTPEQNQYLEAIKMSGDNLLVIINDILDFSRMRSGKIPIEQRIFSLSRVIAMCTELMTHKASEKGIKLITSIDKNIPDELIGDPTRLNQVLINLTANAIKFTAKGEVSIGVNLLSEKNNETELEFTVKDSGIGIAKDKLATIFEAFTQANNDTARRYGGTGLGLAIVKQLIELQGGSIAVSSEEGKGSCFYFRIKYKNNPTSEVSNIKPTLAHKEHIKNLNVLLVEDNTMNQLLTCKVLKEWGWNIEVVENGLEAIEQVKSTHFDLILMDIQMPGMDGYEATRQIRNSLPEPKCHVPIMAMTADVLPSEEEKCYKAGMNGYISKPFDTQTLYSKIKFVLHS
ncbi:MAG: ATP-binding protein [Bacteroidia bacterium]